MRILVFFDLPVMTRGQRRAATQFRNFLLSDGYYMVQYSVYTRVCNSYATVEKHQQRLKEHIPADGSIRLLTITEKQYQQMQILLGEPQNFDHTMEDTSLDIF